MAQEITTETVQPLAEDSGLVRPYDKVKVYATDKAKFVAAGTEIEEHPLLADKLVASGKATKDKPKADKK